MSIKKKKVNKNEWVVYPEPQFSIEELINVKMSEEKIDVSSVKPVESILEIPKEVDVVTEVPDLVDQNQGEIEPIELTEEEKHLKFVEAVKQSHVRYKPKKHFGTAYKSERKRKNKAQRKSRKANRK